jgi:HlyD family secretion protein
MSNLPVVTGKSKPGLPQSQHARTIRMGIGKHLVIGGLAALGLIFGLGGMAAMIDFAGAVVTAGRLVVSSNIKKIQHQTGGTVARINVRDGDKVAAGDILVELDTTLAAANLGIVTKGYYEALARKTRLEAERAGLEKIEFPKDLLDRSGDPEIAQIMAIEVAAFDTRLAAREGQKAQLNKKISELDQQLSGVRAQKEAVTRQIHFTKQEVEGLRVLMKKKLVSMDRMADAERRVAALDGQMGQLIAAEGQIGAETAGANLQILQIDQDMRSEASRELADTGSRINELTERKFAAEDQLTKHDIRSPIAGTVYQLAIHTVGGVVGPGEAMMMIVPKGDSLVVEAQIDPAQVDRVHPEQEAVLRFSSFGSRDTPEYLGTVETVSPDVVMDQRTGLGFYIAKVKLPPHAIDELGSKMVPGIPVEVFISTGERTVLSYLVKPLGDQIMHTFRER